jgi:hypothetical protein
MTPARVIALTYCNNSYLALKSNIWFLEYRPVDGGFGGGKGLVEGRILGSVKFLCEWIFTKEIGHVCVRPKTNDRATCSIIA